MCAGLGIAIRAAPALRGIARTEVFPASAATPPVAALGFAACGLALIAIGLWFPRVASVLAMVTLSIAVVLVLAAAALFLRHTYRWFEKRLGAIAVLGSILFAIGIVGAVSYIADVPTYVWQWRAPMSFLSTVCASIGLTWTQASVIRLMPMLIANGILSVVAARQVRRQALEGRSGLRDPRAAI